MALGFPSDRSAQRLLRRSFFGGVLACGLLAADAWYLEPRWISVVRVPVRLAGLGKAWQGSRIVLLSDTHCGPHTPPQRIARAVEIANGLNPDIVLLLGDYVHQGPRYIAPGIEPFAKLRASEGVFGVLGNHDHWDGRELSVQCLLRAQVGLLINRSVTLRRGADPLVVAGVGDFLEDVQRLEEALAQSPANAPRVLMSHNPDYAEEMPEGVRVDLMVSGHTHGGQVNVPFVGAPILPSRYGKKYQQGWVQGPRCPVYVTRGVSTVSPPVRFLCRPEITLLELAAA